MVSIHTPTRGVTIDIQFVIFLYLVSIHTPTRGVTVQPTIVFINKSCFNPHSHAGSDILRYFLMHIFFVSIHTPTRGVTGKYQKWKEWKQDSIHTPTRGETVYNI